MIPDPRRSSQNSEATNRPQADCGPLDDHAQNETCSEIGKMPTEQHGELHAELTKLHQVLANTSDIDGVLRQDLKQLADDIERALAKPSELTGLREQLKESILGFEVSHPMLTNVLGNLANLLAGVGI